MPGTGKIKGWNGEGVAEHPGRRYPRLGQRCRRCCCGFRCGIDTRYPATDGVWTAFMKGADPSIWQLTDFVIQAQDVFG